MVVISIKNIIYLPMQNFEKISFARSSSISSPSTLDKNTYASFKSIVKKSSEMPEFMPSSTFDKELTLSLIRFSFRSLEIKISVLKSISLFINILVMVSISSVRPERVKAEK